MFQKPLQILRNRKTRVFLLLSLTAIVSIYILYVSNLSYAVIFNGQEIGITKNVEKVNLMVESISKELDNRSGELIEINPEVTYEQVWGINKETDSIEDITKMAEKSIGLKSEAYAFNVDGKDLFYLYSRVDAEEIIKKIKNDMLAKIKLDNVKEVSIIEKINIVPKLVDTSKIVSFEQGYNIIADSKEDVQKYTIKKGETASHIAANHNISLSDMKSANTDINLNKLQIGQILNLTVPEPLVSVVIIEEKNYTEAIPYVVKYEKTSNLYEDETRISFEGSEGKKKVRSRVIYINGKVSEETIIEEKVVKEPVSKIVLKGTIPRPKTLAYGKFYSPTKGAGIITSKFGPRWGSFHKGIDIASPTGTPIVAADGGKVVFSGWKGDYGYIVILDHQNGYHTYYAHCSKLLVKKNEKVYRGQTIAKVGNTGNSTGPHLHFEVRKNGVPLDPLKYINY